ncbi:potassium channel family protein [Microbulbifer hainanensis]|uniref:potassium channel family protein n=1 Tax=Microbulbifer hainanensis TaxID=2735675 RepID=UPI0018676729|nr:potassium channel family protein [Microbulbifer hainanensis]
MLVTFIIALLMTVLTTAIHALGMILALRWGRHLQQLHPAHPKLVVAKPMLVSAVVLLMFVSSVVEVLAWAVAYCAFGAFNALEPAMYFSMVTFTTLGYGDIVLGEPWRLLSAFQSAIGIIMFGWTTAVVIAVVQRVYQKNSD